MSVKKITRDILPKHYQSCFIDVVKSNPYYSVGTEYLLEDSHTSTHGVLLLVDKKTILLEDIKQSISYQDKNCDLDLYLAIMKNYGYSLDTPVDVLTFKNQSYPYLEIQNFIPQLLRQS